MEGAYPADNVPRPGDLSGWDIAKFDDESGISVVAAIRERVAVRRQSDPHIAAIFRPSVFRLPGPRVQYSKLIVHFGARPHRDRHRIAIGRKGKRPEAPVFLLIRRPQKLARTRFPDSYRAVDAQAVEDAGIVIPAWDRFVCFANCR